MIEILHNPRCSKSRNGLAYLQENNISYKITHYLDTPLNKEDILILLKKLNLKPIDLVRKNEVLWKNINENDNLTDDEIISLMAENPIWIERPIFINNEKAVIGRPIENIQLLLP